MGNETQEPPKLRRILVAGDVCIDVVAVPVPAEPVAQSTENWRLTGETRTHFLPGGAMLLAKFIRAPRLAKPLAEAEEKAQAKIRKDKLREKDAREYRRTLRRDARLAKTREIEDEVIGPRPLPPKGIAEGPTTALYQDEFIDIAERLRREEIVHSLIGVKPFATSKDDKNPTLRVEKEHGYSGPMDSAKDPTLVVEYTEYPEKGPVRIIVLDDTGNHFRKGTAGTGREKAAKDDGQTKRDPNPWPKMILREDTAPAADNQPEALIVYKLHRPFPSEPDAPLVQPAIAEAAPPAASGAQQPNPLWNAVVKHHPHNRIVVVSVDDLRHTGAAISLGLSWERTALDVVWHLLHFEGFAAVKNCPRLVVRLGLDGAVLWQSYKADSEWHHQAWLVYDPKCIEGSFALKVDGTMVASGAAFTAALVQRLATGEETPFSALFKPVLAAPKEFAADAPEKLLVEAIEEGLHASRRLLLLGFGEDLKHPNYPGPELFHHEGTGFFCSHPIKLIPNVGEPDRSHWRLLDSIFEGKPQELAAAVALTATARRECTDKHEKDALEALKQVPVASYGALRTHDRGEIENYRALHTLLRDYLCARATQRPLSVAVFGPPGAGKSFGVKEVAASLKGQPSCKDVQDLTFNLSLYQAPEELSGAFHLVRDVALRGKVPLVFFDEFDTSLAGQALGWLRYFLAPMQDGEFLDRGVPHPIGQAIFVFAGGTFGCYDEFKKHPGVPDNKFKDVKGPDFLSRLRATLDIPSLNLLTAFGPVCGGKAEGQPPGTFNPYGPVSSFPCRPAILLRRASILAFNLRKKAPGLVRADGSVNIAPEVLRALFYLPHFEHGNRSFEALLDMSHLAGAASFLPALLPPAFQLPLHANPNYVRHLIETPYPLESADRLAIAQAIQKRYQVQKKADANFDPNSPALNNWDTLPDEFRESNFGQADDIADKLRLVKLWLRKRGTGSLDRAARDSGKALLEPHVEELAKAEHDRWCAQKRRAGWTAGRNTSKEGRIDDLLLHNCLFPWEQLSEPQKDLDRSPIRDIPDFLAEIGYEVVRE